MRNVWVVNLCLLFISFSTCRWVFFIFHSITFARITYFCSEIVSLWSHLCPLCPCLLLQSPKSCSPLPLWPFESLPSRNPLPAPVGRPCWPPTLTLCIMGVQFVGIIKDKDQYLERRVIYIDGSEGRSWRFPSNVSGACQPIGF